MGNPSIRKQFTPRYEPCSTCKSFLWWEGRPGHNDPNALILARCARHVFGRDPEWGCPDWEREPGTDDAPQEWPPTVVSAWATKVLNRSVKKS